MALKITSVININPEKIINGIFDKATYKAMASETYRLMDRYTPERNRVLKDTKKIYADAGSGYIEYTQPYAHYMYIGKLYLAPNGSSYAKRDQKKHATNIDLKYNKEKSQNATSHWDEAMLRDRRADLEKSIEDLLKKRRSGGA